MRLPPSLRHAIRREQLVLALLSLALFLRYPAHHLRLPAPARSASQSEAAGAQAGQPPYLMDFEVYRAAASRWLSGQGATLYAPTTSDSPKMVFKYAPAWAILFSPFAWLPGDTGAILWMALGVMALVYTLWLAAAISRHAGLSPPALTAVVPVLLLLRPLGEEMGNGQANLLWGALLAAFLSLALRGRSWPAAGCLAAAILLKVPALLILPYLWLVRRKHLALQTLGLTLAGAAGSAWLVWPQEPLRLLGRWANALYANGTAYAFEIGNQSVLALLGRLLSADGYGLNVASLPKPLLPWVAIGLLAAALAAVILPHPAAELPPRRLVFDTAALVVLMTIFSPTCYLATYTTLALPLFLAAAALASPGTVYRWDAGSLLLGIGVMLLSLPTHSRFWRWIGLTSWRGETYVFLVFMILPWLGLCLLGWLWRLRSLSDEKRVR